MNSLNARARYGSSARTLTGVYALSVGFSFLWQLAQASLFAGTDKSNMWWHCFLWSLADGLLLLFIVAVGWRGFQRIGLVDSPGTSGYLLMIISGIALAVAVEWLAINIMALWAYTPQMPLLPVLGVGIVPVLRMVLIPPLVSLLVTSRR